MVDGWVLVPKIGTAFKVHDRPNHEGKIFRALSIQSLRDEIYISTTTGEVFNVKFVCPVKEKNGDTVQRECVETHKEPT